MEGWLSAFEELGLVEREGDLIRRRRRTGDVDVDGP
jgi:hypothetical protein